MGRKKLSRIELLEITSGEIKLDEACEKYKIGKVNLYLQIRSFRKETETKKYNNICEKCPKAKWKSSTNSMGCKVNNVGRCVYEKFYGCKCKKGEVVVHLNGNKKDNRPINIYKFPSKELSSTYLKQNLFLKDVNPTEWIKVEAKRLMDTLYNRQWLYEQYILKDKSINRIASENKLCASTVARQIKKYGIYDLREPHTNQHD